MREVHSVKGSEDDLQLPDFNKASSAFHGDNKDASALHWLSKGAITHHRDKEVLDLKRKMER